MKIVENFKEIKKGYYIVLELVREPCNVIAIKNYDRKEWDSLESQR